MKFDKDIPTFIMLVGLPGSGKSTYAEKIKEEGVIIHSSDAIREELGDVNDQSKNTDVFTILHRRIKDDLRDGKNVCMDCTNLSRKRRVAFIRELRNIPCEKICVLIATPFEECCKQNNNRDRRVPDDVMWRMYKNFQIPCKYEGFDKVIVHYGTEEWKTYYGEIEDYVRSLCSFSQDNSHHKLTLGDHMLSAFDSVLHMNGRFYDDVVLAALSHDIGKVDTKTFMNMKGEITEEAHFYSHQNVGCFKSLFFEYPKYCNKEHVALLIELHMNPWLVWEQSEKAKQKELEMFGEDIIAKVELLHQADLYAH